MLPFTNLSEDPAQDYFADGITENLTTDLSRLSGSFVVARNTAFSFKGKNVDARQIGKELGVRYVLEGSVQHDQNQVRVNTQLIDAANGGHLWAERFDRPLSNLFSMQDDIVASLASQLGAELITNEARRAERTPAPNSMDLYFQGMAWFNKGRKIADVDRARAFFDRSVALDPSNLDASLAKAKADLQLAVGYRVDDKAERLGVIEADLNRALSQSPNSALAHYLLGRVFAQTNRLSQAIAEITEGTGVRPNLGGRQCPNWSRQDIRRPSGGDGGLRTQGPDGSPRDTDADVWVAYIALSKLHLGAYEDAAALYRHSIELNPNYPTGRFYFAATLEHLGRHDEARSELKAALALNPEFTIRRYRAGVQERQPGFLAGRERIIEDMRKAGVPDG